MREVNARAITPVEQKAMTAMRSIQRLGGRICLDFTNDVEEWGTRYPALITWSQEAGVLSEGEAARLTSVAVARPGEAAAALEQALALRDAMYEIFAAVAAQRQIAAEDLATLNAVIATGAGHLRLVEEAQGVIWRWEGGENALDRPLWSLARDAADLLTGDDLGRVRECAGDDCERLFVDRSRNRSRRWCEMQHCGMLVKSRRYYARKRDAAITSVGADAEHASLR